MTAIRREAGRADRASKAAAVDSGVAEKLSSSSVQPEMPSNGCIRPGSGVTLATAARIRSQGTPSSQAQATAARTSEAWWPPTSPTCKAVRWSPCRTTSRVPSSEVLTASPT